MSVTASQWIQRDGALAKTNGASAALDSDARVGRLRGAGVSVDPRRLGRVLISALLVGLFALSIGLFLAGANRNAQITELHDHGVPVTVSITGCLGQLGGSGSNAAGYVCRGDLKLNGRTYNEVIPGYALYQPGTKLAAVTVPGDPAMVSTVLAAKAEHASNRVFVLPAVLLVLSLVLSVAYLAWMRGQKKLT